MSEDGVKLTTPLVSVVTPSYNQVEFIEETLSSVSEQTYDHIEHFVKDGGSDDGTLELLKEHNCEWVSEPDRGQAAAINEGFEQVNGDIIGWLNSDDVYFDIRVIERVVRYFEQTDAEIIYGDYAIISRNSEILTVRCLPDFDYNRLRRGCFVAQPSVFFRHDVIKTNRLNEDLDYGIDYEFWLRLARNGYTFKHIKDILSGDRNYPGRKIRRDAETVDTEVTSIQREYGRAVGPKYWLARVSDILFSGIPRRLCGVHQSLQLKRQTRKLAFDASYPDRRTLVHNALQNNTDLF